MILVPEGVDPKRAVSVTTSYLTAYMLIHAEERRWASCRRIGHAVLPLGVQTCYSHQKIFRKTIRLRANSISPISANYVGDVN